MGSGLDKRSVLAFIIIGIIALFMSTDTYRRWIGMPTSEELAAAKADKVAEATVRPDEAPGLATKDARQETVAGLEAAPDPVAINPGSGQGFDFPAGRPEERQLRVSTKLYDVVFSTRGATIVRHELKGLKSYWGDTVVLIDEGRANLIPEFNLGGRQVDTATFLFECPLPDITIVPANGEQLVEFAYTGSDGGRLVKRYVLRDDSYRMDVLIQVQDLSEPIRHLRWGLRWESGLHLTESSAMQDNMYTEALALVGGEMANFRLGRKAESGEDIRKGNVHWVATRNKYFQLALVPLDVKADQVRFTGRQSDPGGADAHGEYAFDLELQLDLDHALSQSFALYLGPLQKNALADMDPSLQQSIMTRTSLGFMGFMWPLIKPFAAIVLWVFTKLNLFISNYGVIIILFSVLVKLAVWPLTAKSHRSMKEMQRIRPLQEELKRKYGSNPKKLQEETMKLFREHKVNPFGGCLPNLLQMPLLFALYFVFRGAFELRGASFVGWITDLSVPDSVLALPFSLPLYGNHVSLLAIIFGVSSFLMMRMTITDQTQKTMLYIMPVMMLFIFNQLPSGLTLYYTLFNLLSAAQQQWMTGGTMPPAPVQAPAPALTMKRKQKAG
ncbi:MAG: membrane protein insertase YidC [bacterium]|nr:membrane protein insertase YidC [bacterium]